MNEREQKEAVRHGIADAIMGERHEGVKTSYGPEYFAAYHRGQVDYVLAHLVNMQLDEREAG
jgi:hypothetical protein